MARRIDLTGENVTRKQRKGRQYGTKTDLSSTTVDRGDTHWMNSSRVSIDGVLDVTGQTTISGALNVSGTTTLSGSTTIAGPTGITGALTIAGSMDVTGPSTFAGTLDITGDTSVAGNFEIIAGGLFKAGASVINPDGSAKFGLFDIAANGNLISKGSLSIEGVTTLKNDLNVTTGGKITAGNVSIDPSVLSGAVTFANGTRLAQTPNGAQFEMAGGGAVTVSPGQADMGVIGGGAVFATSAAARLQAGSAYMEVTATGLINMVGLPTTALPPNLHINASGTIYKSTWTP